MHGILVVIRYRRGVDWQFKTTDARVKLKSLYPVIMYGFRFDDVIDTRLSGLVWIMIGPMSRRAGDTPWP